MKRKNFKYWFFFVSICLLVGWLSSWLVSFNFSQTYLNLKKPFFSPPGWLFAPVWSLLYVMMGTSLFLIYMNNERKINKLKILAFFLFFSQLFLNFLWSIIFFGFNLIFLAFLEIVLLWIFIALTIIVFSRLSKKASRWLWTYFIWVSFALVLNFSIWYIN